MISENLLIHTATLKKKSGEDDYGNPTSGETKTLEKIRVTRIKYNPLSSLGEAVNDRLTLFYDCKVSLPAGVAFEAGDIVTYKNKDYRVREVLEAENESPHHYRVVLAG